MNVLQQHQTLIQTYQAVTQTSLRFRIYPAVFQIGIWCILFFLNYLHVNHLNLIAVSLFAIFLLMRLKDFRLRRMLDEKMASVVLNGKSLEKANPQLKPFFGEVLKKNGIIRAVLVRAMYDVMGLFFLGCATHRLILENYSDLSINFNVVYLVPTAAVFVLGKLYVKPFQAFRAETRKNKT